MGSGVEVHWPYFARGAALDLFKCRDMEVLIEGPAGTGKSRGAMEKAYMIARKYAGSRGAFFRKTRASMSITVLPTWENHVVPPTDPVLQGPRPAHRTEYTFNNGSVIMPIGLDKPDRMMSMDLDYAIVFEATELTEHDWETILTRIGRNRKVPYRQAIADCNPGPFGHWLNQRANRGQMTRLRSRHADNPVWHDGNDWTDAGSEYLKTLNALSGHRRVRLLEGRWASAEGVVYPEFDPEIHIIDPVPIEDSWRRIRGIDFGYRNPTACLFCAVDHDDVLHVCREIYHTQMTSTDLAQEISRLQNRGKECHPWAGCRETVADSENPDGREELRRAGVPNVTVDKSVLLGINDVRERLRVRGNGRPGLVIHRDCLLKRDPSLAEAYRPCSVVDEFDSYVWAKASGEGPQKDRPDKSDDHGLDALRYVCRYLAKPPPRPKVY